MSQDYSKLRNADLESLLKERSLPSGGKKADMVARLIESDKNPNAVPNTSNTTSAPKTTEDEIDWDDSPAVPADAGRTANPLAVPNQTASTDTAASAPATTAAIAPAPIKPEPSFATGLKATDVDAELAKRKARAAKFGTTVDDNETIKSLERAKRFGGGAADAGGEAAPGGVNRLDQALPERRAGRKRGPPDGDNVGFEDAGLKRRRGGGEAGRGRGGRGGERRGTPTSTSTSNAAASWMSEADRAKAEARKTKFGGAKTGA